MAQQVPAIGRVVHYVAYGTPAGEYPAGKHRAAMITAIDPDPVVDNPVGIIVFNPTGIFFHEHVQFDPTGTQPGTWHWPEFVPAEEA